jgi:hypothetical protein
MDTLHQPSSLGNRLEGWEKQPGPLGKPPCNYEESFRSGLRMKCASHCNINKKQFMQALSGVQINFAVPQP